MSVNKHNNYKEMQMNIRISTRNDGEVTITTGNWLTQDGQQIIKTGNLIYLMRMAGYFQYDANDTSYCITTYLTQISLKE
jgi:hypothetical protein